MMLKNSLRWAVLLVLAALLCGAMLPPTLAQEGDRAPLVLVVARGLAADNQPYATLLADALTTALDGSGLSFTIEIVQIAARESMDAAEDNPNLALALEVSQPRALSPDRLQLTWWVNSPPGETLFTPALQASLLNAAPLWAGVERGDLAAAAVDLTLALAAYGAGYCADHAVAVVWRSDPPATLENAPLLDLYAALCHHAAGAYDAAFDILTGDTLLPALTASQFSWRMARLRDAYAADALAQQFQFERAITWDDRAILLMETVEQNSLDPRAVLMLAELYLLRGQHRLYQYSWDDVLADYNAALATGHAPPRAFYLRGVLYYTVGDYPAAYADFVHFLALADDPDDPDVSAAQGYVEDLARILATPTAETD